MLSPISACLFFFMLQGTPAPTAPHQTVSVRHPRGRRSSNEMSADRGGVNAGEFYDRMGVGE